MGEGLKQLMLSSPHRAAEEEEEEEELEETSSLSGGESDHDVAHQQQDDEEEDDPSSSLQLPPKRGLSKYYQGKSQSFSSFSDVSCVGDLAKKETPYKRKKKMVMKTCRSYAGGLDEHHNNYGPSSGGGTSSPYNNKSTPTTNSRGNGACASLISRTGTLFSSGHGKPPPIPIQRNN